MKKILLFLLLLPALLFAQNQGGVIIVGGVAVHQPDTSAYKVINTIQAEGTSLNGNNRFYVTYLVALSKRDSLWQKSKSFYGFIGGTSASHKWNWKDMRNVDGAFRLTFPNGMTHDSFGITGNSSTQYADTKLDALSNLTVNNYHISYYSSKNTNPNSDDRNMGASTNGNASVMISSRRNNGVALFNGGNSFGFNLSSVQTTRNTGYIIGNVLSSNNNGLYLNSIYSQANANYGVNNLPNINFYIQALNSNNIASQFTNKSCGFASIGSGLTDTQAIQSSNTITFAQGILGRK